MLKWLKFFLIALIGALIGKLTGFPIGPMLGSMLFVTFFQNRYRILSFISIKVRRTIQIVIGSSLGLTFTTNTVQVIKSIWFLILLLPILHILLTLIISIIVIKIYKIDPITTLCSFAPAGAGEMLIISQRYNSDLSMVATLHAFRVSVIVSIIPPIIISFL